MACICQLALSMREADKLQSRLAESVAPSGFPAHCPKSSHRRTNALTVPAFPSGNASNVASLYCSRVTPVWLGLLERKFAGWSCTPASGAFADMSTLGPKATSGDVRFTAALGV